MVGFLHTEDKASDIILKPLKFFPEGDKWRLLSRVAVILPEQHRLEIFGDKKLKEKVGCEAKDLQTALM